MSEPFSAERVQEKTGKTWDEWYQILDDAQAKGWTHADIARFLAESHGLDGWYCQSITVAYERARGLRSTRADRDGTFNASVSKTFPVAVEVLFAAWVDDAQREAWLGADVLNLRTSSALKSARFDLIESGTILPAYFSVRGDAKSSVQIEESGLASADDVEHRKADWRKRFDDLGEYLKGK